MSKKEIEQVLDEIAEHCQEYFTLHEQSGNFYLEFHKNRVMDWVDEHMGQKSKKVKTTRGFVPPTLEEVESYATEKGYSNIAKKFHEYFTVGDWTDSKGQKVKNWKQKFITWATYNAGGRKGAETKTVNHEYDYLYDSDLTEL